MLQNREKENTGDITRKGGGKLWGRGEGIKKEQGRKECSGQVPRLVVVKKEKIGPGKPGKTQREEEKGKKNFNLYPQR